MSYEKQFINELTQPAAMDNNENNRQGEGAVLMTDGKTEEELSWNTSWQITITGRDKEALIECGSKENLLEAMVRQNIYISADCGGRGTCGKCKVQLLKGRLRNTVSASYQLTEKEIEEGFCLACKAYPSSDCTIHLVAGDETDFEVVTEPVKQAIQLGEKEDRFALGIDIGTTTIAIRLTELCQRANLYTYTAVNRQRAYGSDVLARMGAANQGKLKELRESIQRDLLSGIQEIVSVTGINKNKIDKIAIAGNTTMGHLLLGYSCQTLGVHPFNPVNIKTTSRPFEEVFASDYLEIPVILLPGISTFVGADIAAGLLECDYDKTDTVRLLIDLGTNAEMAIGNKDRILVSSAAAGPAFEGGNISCGVGSIVGAICNIDRKDGLGYRTIGDKAPVGICGTGVLELVYELLKTGLIDETGLLLDEYFEDGYKVATDPNGKAIVFTQRDIREIQLAKAAVRAGIEILVKRYGVKYKDIDTVYLAGGFGYKMNVDKAIGIGLLPEELTGKIKAIGNSSLQGAVKFLTQGDASDRIKHIVDLCRELHLSNDEDFNEKYLEYMYFQ